MELPSPRTKTSLGRWNPYPLSPARKAGKDRLGVLSSPRP